MSSEEDILRNMPRRYHEEYLDDDGSFECPSCGNSTFDYVVLKRRRVCPDCADVYADIEITRIKEEGAP